VILLVATGMAMGVVLGACGGDHDDTGAGEAVDGTGGAVSGEVVVFAAASLTDAFTAIGDVFVADHPGAHVTFNFAASSELATQIIEGAPVDVYASANVENMARLTAAGATAGEPTVFAVNSSAIVVEKANPQGITSVADLADPDLVVVTCAPQVPCGDYASRIFANAGVTVTPDSYEANVKAVVTKVALGEADAGIAYATDIAVAADDVDGVSIPADLDVVAEYPIATTAEAPNAAGGRAFVALVTSAVGEGILESFGFGSP